MYRKEAEIIDTMHELLLSPPFVLAIISLFSPTVVGLLGSPKERCGKGAKFAYNFLDCTSYYVCVHESPVLMPCPSDLVFSMRKESCVHRYDFTADCSSSVTLPPGLGELLELTDWLTDSLVD